MSSRANESAPKYTTLFQKRRSTIYARIPNKYRTKRDAFDVVVAGKPGTPARPYGGMVVLAKGSIVGPRPFQELLLIYMAFSCPAVAATRAAVIRVGHFANPGQHVRYPRHSAQRAPAARTEAAPARRQREVRRVACAAEAAAAAEMESLVLVLQVVCQARIGGRVSTAQAHPHGPTGLRTAAAHCHTEH